LSHLDASGLELMLEIEIDRKCHLVLVDSGDSLSVMKPGISSSELQATQTAARGITGNKLKATEPNISHSGRERGTSSMSF